MGKSIRSKTKRFYRSVKRSNLVDAEKAKIEERNARLAELCAEQEAEVQARRAAARAEREAAAAATTAASKERAAKREAERASVMKVDDDDERDFPMGKPYGRNSIKRLIKRKKRSASKHRPSNFHKGSRSGK